jgi:hypothetical protein
MGFDDPFFPLAVKAHGEVDDRLGKQFADIAGERYAKTALLAIAGSHLMGAKALLELALGPRKAAEIMRMAADETAAQEN